MEIELEAEFAKVTAWSKGFAMLLLVALGMFMYIAWKATATKIVTIPRKVKTT